MREIKGIIFDCDGTLADTMPLHWKAWQTVTTKHGLHFPEDRFYSLGGVPSRDIFKMLCSEQGKNLDCLALSHEKENAYLPFLPEVKAIDVDRKSTRLNSSHSQISYAVFCLKKKINEHSTGSHGRPGFRFLGSWRFWSRRSVL